MYGHGAVFTKEFQGSVQETVASVTRITIDCQDVVGRLWLDGELAILGLDLSDRRNHLKLSFIPNWELHDLKKVGGENDGDTVDFCLLLIVFDN